MWQQLIDVLHKICNTYDELAKIGEKKRYALVNVDMKVLSQVIEQEQIITSKIQTLEKQRGSIIKEISKTNQKVNSATNAHDIYKAAPTPYITKKLSELHDQLSQNVKKNLKLREHNQILAQTSLDNVTFKLNRISGAFVEPAYGTKGTIVTHRQKFDYQA